jgi:Ankyrin repeats (many copies)
MRELLGAKLGEGLGVPRAAADVLIGKATSLDLPLPQAIRGDRVEYVRLLLGAGADPGTRTDGITPLETAIYFGRPQMVDLLAEHGIVPAALWTYAACGRLDLVRACFDADGRLRPDAALSRPNPVDYLPVPPRIPAADDPEQIMAEAFVHACQHGRTEVVRWFLDRGLNPDVAPYFGRTGLVWAVMSLQPEVVGLLMERGADPARGGEMVPFGAEGLVAILFATDRHDPVIRQLHELLKPRSAELPPQVPSRRSPSVDRTTGAVRPVPQPAIRHEIHEAFMTSPPPSSAGGTSSLRTAPDPLIHDPERLRVVATLAALPDGDALALARLHGMLGLTPGRLITCLRELDHAGYVGTESGAGVKGNSRHTGTLRTRSYCMNAPAMSLVRVHE